MRLFRAEIEKGLQGVELGATKKRIAQIGQLIEQLMTKSELSGPAYEDIIHLKSMYSRYQNYAHWLQQSAAR